MTAWLTAEGVTYSYSGAKTGRPVLLDVGFAVPESAPVLVIVGPSGAGKSTLLKLLAGHLRPQAGRLTFCGAPIDGPSAARPVVFQDYNLLPWKNVLDNVTFGLKCAGAGKEERDRRGRELLARLRLGGSEALYPAELSGGMQQRVGLARALAVSPRCILMDEPLSALDDAIKLELCREITRLVAEEQTRFVVVTHDLAAAAYLGDRALLLPGGRAAREVSLPHEPHPRPWEDLDAPQSLARRQALRAALAAAEPANPDPVRP